MKRPEFDTLPQREDETVYTCIIMYRGLKETCETSGSSFNVETGTRECLDTITDAC